MTKDVEFLIDVVKQASELVTEEFEINAKGENGDLVTNFDFEIEKFIIDKIKDKYPEFDIVSEEFNTKFEVPQNCFLIDPIDGTINFAHGVPMWAIQVACVKNGEMCASVVYAPRLNELYYADESGAYLNGKKIHVSKLQMDKVIYSVEGKLARRKVIEKIETILPSINLRHFYTCAIEYAYVARGAMGILAFVNDTPWDYYPGFYLVKQAGGYLYNEPGMHIAGNSKEIVDLFVREMKKKT